MKKLLALLCICCGFSFAHAQSSFQLGLTAVPTIGWIKPDVDGVDQEENRIGFNYGLLGDFNIAENYAFSTGIKIINTGSVISYPDVQTLTINGINVPALGRTEADLRLKYIEIPLTFKLKTNQIGYITYYGQFGFGAAVNYDAEADLTFRSPNSSANLEQNEEDFADEISLFRASLIVGLGAEYNISGNTSILMGLSFNNGFTNIFDLDVPRGDSNGNAIANSDNRSVKAINNFIALNLGVLF